jgi:hypothetical protein
MQAGGRTSLPVSEGLPDGEPLEVTNGGQELRAILQASSSLLLEVSPVF